MRGVVAVALLARAVSPAAADTTDAARMLLDAGVDKFNAGNFAEARTMFEHARELAPDKPNPHRWLGLTDARLGHCDDAVSELDVFMRMVPVTDERMREASLARDLCNRQLDARGGTLVVESAPAGAVVRLDENPAPRGTTPLTQEGVSVGAHVVHLERAGYRGATASVSIDRKQPAKVSLTLEPEAPPTPSVATAPVIAPIAVEAAPPKPRPRRRYWIAGAVAGAAAVVVGSIVLGVTLSNASGSPPTASFGRIPVQ